jgi:hypothetical protein
MACYVTDNTIPLPIKKENSCLRWQWIMPIIPATQEAENRRIPMESTMSPTLRRRYMVSKICYRADR